MFLKNYCGGGRRGNCKYHIKCFNCEKWGTSWINVRRKQTPITTTGKPMPIIHNKRRKAVRNRVGISTWVATMLPTSSSHPGSYFSVLRGIEELIGDRSCWIMSPPLTFFATLIYYSWSRIWIYTWTCIVMSEPQKPTIWGCWRATDGYSSATKVLQIHYSSNRPNTITMSLMAVTKTTTLLC